MIEKETVNGKELRMYRSEDCDYTGAESVGRRLLRHDYVDEVNTGPYIGVWIKGKVVGFQPPEGWQIVSVSHFPGSRTCVRLERE